MVGEKIQLTREEVERHLDNLRKHPEFIKRVKRLLTISQLIRRQLMQNRHCMMALLIIEI